MSAATDRPAKLERVRGILDEHDASALALTTPETLAWFFDGARVAVPYAGAAVCSAIVRRDGTVTVTALANELDRLREEELTGDGIEFRSVAWHGSLDPGDGVLRDTSVATRLRAARAALLPLERQRYAQLGREVAASLSRVLHAVRPESSEHGLAAELVRAVVELGAEPVVTLVAGSARSGVQHPLPTAAPLGTRAMAVVGARRHGLIVNATRWVRFGTEPGGVEGAAEAALLEVEADALAATRPGRPLHDVLADIARSYGEHGFGTDAWRRHHQGGPTGYLGRDPKATPETGDLVVAGQAFAWNPWVPGAKLEDTVIVDEHGIDVLTADPDWPTIDVRGVPRPLTLNR